MDISAALDELVCTPWLEAEEVAEQLRSDIWTAYADKPSAVYEAQLDKAIEDIENILVAKRRLYEQDREVAEAQAMRVGHEHSYEREMERLRAQSDPETKAAWDATHSVARLAHLQSVDWLEMWRSKKEVESWLIPHLVPEGRQVAVYSVAKQGKSLVALDAVAAACTGGSIFGGPALPAPIDVLYLDQEMTRDDLKARLESLGYTAADNLDRLHYYQLQAFPPLDDPDGGAILEGLALEHGAQLVIIDTMARLVNGEENAADTYRSFYRHTGRRLKLAGISMLRLDHAGKNIDSGQRGSSAKVDDVDVVFQLTYNEETGQVLMKQTHSRVPWVHTFRLTREVEPLTHRLTEGWDNRAIEVAALLDKLHVPSTASVRVSQSTLKHHGTGRSNELVAAAVRYRSRGQSTPQEMFDASAPDS